MQVGNLARYIKRVAKVEETDTTLADLEARVVALETAP